MTAPASAAAEVVGRLTRKQREAVVGRRSIEGVWFNLNGSRAGGAYSRMCDRLAVMGLVDRHGPHPLTPLGLEVRALLLKDQ